MSDTELQAARRRYEATGRVEDEAELLAAELRIGELDLSRLLLAAGLGHPAARRLAEDAAPLELLDLLCHVEPEVRARTWLGIGAAVLARYPDRNHAHELYELEAALAFQRPWPSSLVLADMTPLVGAVDFDLLRDAILERYPALATPSGVEGILIENEAGGYVPPPIEDWTWSAGPPPRDVPDLETILRWAPEARQLVAGELITWALGRGDPVAERVQAREGT